MICAGCHYAVADWDRQMERRPPRCSDRADCLSVNNLEHMNINHLHSTLLIWTFYKRTFAHRQTLQDIVLLLSMSHSGSAIRLRHPICFVDTLALITCVINESAFHFTLYKTDESKEFLPGMAGRKKNCLQQHTICPPHGLHMVPM